MSIACLKDYTLTVGGTMPVDFYWQFQNDFVDSVAGLTFVKSSDHTTPTFSFVPGKILQGLTNTFQTGEMITSPNNASLVSGVTGLTVGCWASFTGPGEGNSNQPIYLSLVDGSGTEVSGMILEFHFGFLLCIGFDEFNNISSGPIIISPVSPHVFHLCFAQWDVATGEVRFYVDGALRFTASGLDLQSGIAAGNLQVLTDVVPGNNWKLDEFMVFKRSLTSGDRSFLYNGGAGRAYPLAM